MQSQRRFRRLNNLFKHYSTELRDILFRETKRIEDSYCTAPHYLKKILNDLAPPSEPIMPKKS